MDSSKFVGKQVKILLSSKSGGGSASTTIVVMGTIKNLTNENFIEVSDATIEYVGPYIMKVTSSEKTTSALINKNNIISIFLI